MVISISWDSEENSTNKDFQQQNVIATFSEGKSLCHKTDLLKTHLILSVNTKAPSVVHLAALVSQLHQLRHSTKPPAEDPQENSATTENIKELCRFLTTNFNTFIVMSAVGAATIHQATEKERILTLCRWEFLQLAPPRLPQVCSSVC